MQLHVQKMADNQTYDQVLTTETNLATLLTKVAIQ